MTSAQTYAVLTLDRILREHARQLTPLERIDAIEALRVLDPDGDFDELD